MKGWLKVKKHKTKSRIIIVNPFRQSNVEMLLEKSKRLRGICQKKAVVRKEPSKNHKSRNLLSKVQSRKTCCEIQLSQGNSKKPAVVKRNSFIYSTVAGSSHTKRTAPVTKAKQNVIEITKGTAKSRPETQSNKKHILLKRGI